ncbi:hypothetical protein Hypma_007597 [Hypsizygus marmoreus]|uniref:Uncharacterized protein n=1 Tax=Hypsizygus marmoreus TaxID=39966 RepID=A0A369JXJ9_HYPMA|nr:hypothetical protein Hypma_007597 [Hypsizygus marmoreus]
MKFASALTYMLALFVVASTARPTLEDLCGVDAVLLEESTTIIHDGEVMRITTTSCRGFANITSDSFSAGLSKRAVTQCDPSPTACSILCDPSQVQPSLSDCNRLNIALDQLTPNDFLVPAQTARGFSLGTCAFVFGNPDIVDYNVCAIGLATRGLSIATRCMVTGFCISPGVSNNNWFVEVIHS